MDKGRALTQLGSALVCLEYPGNVFYGYNGKVQPKEPIFSYRPGKGLSGKTNIMVSFRLARIS